LKGHGFTDCGNTSSLESPHLQYVKKYIQVPLGRHGGKNPGLRPGESGLPIQAFRGPASFERVRVSSRAAEIGLLPLRDDSRKLNQSYVIPGRSHTRKLSGIYVDPTAANPRLIPNP
jgi:hypothetical protein